MSKQGDMIVFTLAVGVLAATMLTAKYLKTPFDAIFEQAASQRGLDADLLRAIAKHESNLQPDVIAPEPSRPGHSSYGLMQIFDTTADSLGITDYNTLLDPQTNVQAASRLLQDIKSELGDRDSLDAEISAYNEGVGGFLKRGIYDPEYVAAVKQNYYLYKVGATVGA